MIKVVGREFMRAGEKVGWLEGNHIIDRNGKRLGYAEGNYIYNASGHKIGWIEGDYLYTPGDKKMRLVMVHEAIQEGLLNEAQRAAVLLFLGE